MSDVRIIRAGPDDIELARQAVEEIHERHLCDGDALRSFLDDSNCYLLLALWADRVVGSLNGFRLRQPHRAKPAFLLYEIDVRPDFRNRGVGKTLINSFTTEARAAGASEVWTVTNMSNAPAMTMYMACGFARANPDDVMLVRPL